MEEENVIRGEPTHSGEPGGLPDPSLPPTKRGSWDEAAVTNVKITELVKRQIKTVTRPQNR